MEAVESLGEPSSSSETPSSSLRLNLLHLGPDDGHPEVDGVENQEVPIILELDADQLICLLCGKVVHGRSNEGQHANTVMGKQVLIEIAILDPGYLGLDEDALGFCPLCSLKVEQLRAKFEKFVEIRDQVVELSTEIGYEVKRTNNQMLKGLSNQLEAYDDAFFYDWNFQRIQAMLLKDLKINRVVQADHFMTELEEKTAETYEDLGAETISSENYSDPDPNLGLNLETSRDIAETSEASHKPQEIQQQLKADSINELNPIPDVEDSLDSFPCQNCGDVFSSYDVFRKHLRSHVVPVKPAKRKKGKEKIEEKPEPEKPEFLCEVCSKSFRRGYNLRLHMRSHGVETEYLSCDKCEKKFTCQKTHTAHQRVHEKEKPKHRCPICNKTVISKGALDAHLHRHHVKDYAVSTISCDICSKSFESPLLLMKHMDVHSGEYQCSVASCKKAFKSCARLEKHEKIHTGSGETTYHDCDFCSLTFDNEQDFLTHHKEEHPLNQAFLCHSCGKSFPSRSLLNRHMQLHKHVENRCELCDKSFSSASNLKNHVRLHTGERPFQCSVCDQNFTQKVSLTLHMRKHSGVNPFTCPHCKTTGFSYKLALRQHLASKHEDIYLKTKPFLCKICWKNFSTEAEQAEHDALHEKHKCKLCNRQFKMLTHLKEHLLRHASLKPHKCIFCEDKAFLRKKGLIDHIKREHPNEDAEAAAETDNVTYIVHINS